MIIRRDGSWLESGGAPAGMFPDWIYAEGTAQLKLAGMRCQGKVESSGFGNLQDPLK
jgi:hypothetical protein